MNKIFRRRSDLAIEAKDPFAHDKLGFRDLILPLTRLLEKTPGPYVIAVSSEYGTGKTTFLKMWGAQLQNEGARALYFDAWEHDFIEPPLTALIGEIEAQIEAVKSADKAKDALHKAGLATIQAVGPTLLKEALSLSAVALARIALGEAGATQLREISGKLGDVASSYAKDRIEQYKKERGTLKNFRIALQDFAEAVSSKDRGASENKFIPLVIFIDELDRCRPTYAVELLETVKHLFAVPGVIFILGMNRDALAQSMQAVYGPSFDGTSYLRRFIDLPYFMPNPSLEAFCKQIAEEFIPEKSLGVKPSVPYYRFLGFDADVPYQAVCAAAAARFADIFRRSLRDLEQIFSRAGASLATLPTGDEVEPAYFMFLMVLQDAEPDIYRSFKDRRPHSFDETLKTKYRTKLGEKNLLDVIAAEAMAAHHLTDKDLIGRDNALRAHLQSNDPIKRADEVRFGVIHHGLARVRRATDLVDFSLRLKETT